MIVGLTGRNASGKGTAAQFFQSIGFFYYSLSDELRSILQEEGLALSRENLIRRGTELREKFGDDFLARRVFVKLDPEKNYVIDSIRHPHEVHVFRMRKDFRLVHIHADARVRFERLQKRNRPGDPATFKEFLELEEKELDGGSGGQRIDACEELADVIIENNGTIEELHKTLREWTRRELMNQQRPTWDEYFMHIAKVTALRSNCLKRRVAALVVKDGRIISTGYNGTPRGVPNCIEGGCPRCATLGAPGQSLDSCVCCHAEENAIAQAALHGIRLEGATLYCTLSPCLLCAKLIINAGIREVVYEATYALEERVTNLFETAGVKIRKIEKTSA